MTGHDDEYRYQVAHQLPRASTIKTLEATILDPRRQLVAKFKWQKIPERIQIGFGGEWFDFDRIFTRSPRVGRELFCLH